MAYYYHLDRSGVEVFTNHRNMDLMEVCVPICYCNIFILVFSDIEIGHYVVCFCFSTCSRCSEPCLIAMKRKSSTEISSRKIC